jgi:hypothetical protein
LISLEWMRRARPGFRPPALRLTVYHFDLGEVTTPEQLQNVFAAYFELPADYREMWHPLYAQLREQERPYDGALVIFDGWRAFAKRMPRYAKRIKTLLGYGYRQHIAARGRIIAHFE